MRKLILVVAILITSSATASEIVWRSPTAGVLSTVSDDTHPTETEQPIAGIHYEPVSFFAGSSLIIKPVGDVSGYTFSLAETMPPGLTFDSKTGRIVGVAAVPGNHSVTVRAEKGGFFADLLLLLTIT